MTVPLLLMGLEPNYNDAQRGDAAAIFNICGRPDAPSIETVVTWIMESGVSRAQALETLGWFYHSQGNSAGCKPGEQRSMRCLVEAARLGSV